MLKVFLVSALCLSYKGYKVKHCQDINFKISLSMFGLKENILYKCTKSTFCNGIKLTLKCLTAEQSDILC